MKKIQTKNYRRRTIGTFVCFLPILLPLASLVKGTVHHQSNYFSSIGFVIAGAFIAANNLYWCAIRPSIFRARHGTDAEYRGPSPVPLIGNIFAILGVLFGFGAIGTAAISLLVVSIDFGGLPWFVLSTWRDSGLWDSTT